MTTEIAFEEGDIVFDAYLGGICKVTKIERRSFYIGVTIEQLYPDAYVGNIGYRYADWLSLLTPKLFIEYVSKLTH